MTAPGPDDFEYLGYDLDAHANTLVCRYRCGAHEFAEQVHFPAGGAWDDPAVDAAARWVFLLAGVSYYKTLAPRVVHAPPLTDFEREFLRTFYVDGLGEFAYRNGLDLTGLEIVAESRTERSVDYRPRHGRPLVPFGGGLDSIVTVELLRDHVDDPALFVVNTGGRLYDAIELPAKLTGWPVVRAERTIDPLVLSKPPEFLNGHVPVTGVISAISVMAAVLGGHDAVVMSNEWSASSATLFHEGRAVNHQYSKSYAFEGDFRRALAASIGTEFEYFSMLRSLSELWIARYFAQLPGYIDAFRSCNKAFHIDPAKRLDHWCGVCDKCAFIDLILSPFVDAEHLRRVFDGAEPLENPTLVDTFDALLGLGEDAKPWECVGDVRESRAAAHLAADRPDRAGNELLRRLADDGARIEGLAEATLLKPMGAHFIPDRYLPDDLVG